MTLIYDLIQSNPAYFAWAFGLVNIGWGGFAYFNSKRHDRELVSLKHSLDLDLERRKHTFDLRSTQYDRYAKLLDGFGNKHQTQMLQRMQPAMGRFMTSMASARSESEQQLATGDFSSEVLSLMSEASNDYIQIQAESRSLRLSSSDELCRLLDEMEQLMKESIEIGTKLVANIPARILAGKSEQFLADEQTNSAHGRKISAKSKEIELQMRKELREF
ncbi:MAG: hypothetical protein ACT4NL_15290 [Pseudomarimonas sp.]